MWELDYKESWVQKNWCFWTVVLEKTLEGPLDCKEIKPVNPKGNQSWIFIGRTDAEAETPILWPPDAKSWIIWKTLMLGKIEGGRRRGWPRMRWLDGITDSMDMKVKVKGTQSCPTLCDPMDHTVHGIFQARILEWVNFPFSRGLSQAQGLNPGLPPCRQILYQLNYKGSPSGHEFEWTPGVGDGQGGPGCCNP